MWEMIESFLMIAAITGGLIWYALVLAKKEDRETESSAGHAKLQESKSASATPPNATREFHDPDAHLGHTGSE